jgi:hypothetical protein
MPNPHDVLGPTVIDYESWRDLLCSMCGRHYSEGIEPNAFAGWVRPVTARGFTALDIGCNAHQIERTYRDVRLDGADHYFTLFQASGQLAMIHNDQAVRLAVGDVALVDAARPSLSARSLTPAKRLIELSNYYYDFHLPRPFNAIIDCGNVGSNLWGVGGRGLRLGPGSRGREPAPVL